MKIRLPLLSIAGSTLAIGTMSAFFTGNAANAIAPQQAQLAPTVEARVAERTQNAQQRLDARNDRAEQRDSQRSANIERRAIKLEANKLRVCEKRQDQIVSIMQQIADRGTAQIEVFDRIADRTKEFYAAKGYTIPEFTTLAAEVDAKYDAALAASNDTIAVSESWTCSMDDPKGNIIAMRNAKTAEVDALKEYKTAIRNLIIAVKSASMTNEENR